MGIISINGGNMGTTQGQRIRHLREKLGYSLEDIGNAIGTTRQNIFKYESGDITNRRYPQDTARPSSRTRTSR